MTSEANGNGPQWRCDCGWQGSDAHAHAASHGAVSTHVIEGIPARPADILDALPPDVRQEYIEARTELAALSGCLAKVATATSPQEVREWGEVVRSRVVGVGMRWLRIRSVAASVAARVKPIDG